MLAELWAQLSLVYTPAYEPDANGTLVEVRASHAASSRIIITAETRESKQASAKTHLETLARTPLALLRPIGSFAPGKRPTQSQLLAA